MATALFLRWDGVTVDQYDQVRALANWEGDTPAGAQFHAAAFVDGGLRVFDMWDSAEDFQAFFRERVMPAVARVGIAGEPEVELTPVHATFTPAFQPA